MVELNGVLIGHAGFPAGLCQDLAFVCNRPEGETYLGAKIGPVDPFKAV